MQPRWTTAQMAPDWAVALADVDERLRELDAFVESEVTAGHDVLPASQDVLRAFTRPLADVRVVIVGQDPYPTPGHPVGLAFSVRSDVSPLPRSLVNILRELEDDIGVPVPSTGDLSAWADHGVLLLNTVLTVRSGASGSHRGKGWEAVTDRAIEALAARGGPLVAVLWGRDAQRHRHLFGEVPVVASAHPSPLSAHRGFFGSRPFSRADALLVVQGAAPVDWRLPVDTQRALPHDR